MAWADRNTVDAISAPCSVKAVGKTLECSMLLNWSQFATSSPHSFSLSRKTKSSGNRTAFRLTCSFNRFVLTPYNGAKCRSKITGKPRTQKIWIFYSI